MKSFEKRESDYLLYRYLFAPEVYKWSLSSEWQKQTLEFKVLLNFHLIFVAEKSCMVNQFAFFNNVTCCVSFICGFKNNL